jgi:hypothetical protein
MQYGAWTDWEGGGDVAPPPPPHTHCVFLCLYKNRMNLSSSENGAC